MVIHKSKYWKIETSHIKENNRKIRAKARFCYYINGDGRVWHTKVEMLDLQKLLNKIFNKKKNAKLASKKK